VSLTNRLFPPATKPLGDVTQLLWLSAVTGGSTGCQQLVTRGAVHWGREELIGRSSTSQ
jgi:hypothetical protein